ncbi:unnamed protein product [Effrenium voratum]|nr:unnamed protein product [Effrenium voratum]
MPKIRMTCHWDSPERKKKKKKSNKDQQKPARHCQLSEQILTHLCWSGTRLAAVGQDGRAHVLDLGESAKVVACRQQHELEAWCVELAESLVLTGADDSYLVAWDPRSPEPAWRNRSHEAGVTALALNPHDGSELLTGSYDERLRLFDLRQMKAPLASSERLGDGAYQLSWHPFCPGLVAVAAMRRGFPIFWVRGGFEKADAYCEDAEEGCHGSLGYGISWQFSESRPYMAASASFYDNSVHLWTAQIA